MTDLGVTYETPHWLVVLETPMGMDKLALGWLSERQARQLTNTAWSIVPSNEEKLSDLADHLEQLLPKSAKIIVIDVQECIMLNSRA
jgi:hypothetical protein